MSADRLIWFKRKLVPAKDALVPVLSPTAQFGLNVFEGIRGYWDGQNLQLFRFEDHLKRLFESCKLIGIKCPYSANEITDACIAVVHGNQYKCDIALRVTIFVDEEGSWSSSTPVDMFVAPIAKSRNIIADDFQCKACISTWSRIHDTIMPPRTKLGANYINGRYAHLEATRAGFDFPILLDRDGYVSEGAGSCFFFIRNGKLITPDLTSSVLESITRDTIIYIAKKHGLVIEERKVDRTELYIADEAFLCGSAVELMPITSIDNLDIGNGHVGPVTKDLHKAYIDVVSGSDNTKDYWLTPVYGS